jgi:hypothetical protein
MAAIVLSTKNNEEISLMLQLCKKLKIKAVQLSDEDIEDAYLAKMIDAGMKSGKNIPLSRIRKKLVR